MDFRISFDLGQHGWATFTLAVGTQAVTVGPVGYCTDVLGDLIRAALLVASGGVYHQVSFDGEPREWRLILQRVGPTSLPRCDVRLRVLTLPDINNPAPDSVGEVEFDAVIGVDAFAHSVAGVARGLWEQYGAVGYAEAWSGYQGFPLRALEALDAALLTTDPEGAGA